MSDFEVCKSAGCRKVSALGYTESVWAGISGIFEPTPTTREAEREHIKISVAAMEQIIGAKNGTADDAPENKRYLGTGNQLDCILEATNMTVALLLIEKEGLLLYHRVGYPHPTKTEIFYKVAIHTSPQPFTSCKLMTTTQSIPGSLKTANLLYAYQWMFGAQATIRAY